MAHTIKNKIETYIAENNITIAEFERKAGLKINAVRNILNGRSNNPNPVTLRSIAKVLGSSVDLLLENITNVQSHKKQELLIENNALWLESLKAVSNTLEDKEYKATFEQMFNLSKEVYIFAQEKEPPQIDKAFVNWIINKTL